MLKNQKLWVAIIFIIIFQLTLCRYPEDLIMEIGKDKKNSVRFVGRANNFFCDDPAYVDVRKEKTFTLQFADGSTKYLCEPVEGHKE